MSNSDNVNLLLVKALTLKNSHCMHRISNAMNTIKGMFVDSINTVGNV